MGTNVTTSFITCPKEEKETLGIKLPFLVMIIKNVLLSSHSSKSISHSRCKCSMTKMCAEDSELATISRQLESSHSSAPCLWGSTRDGTRSSSTCQILPAEPTEATTSRPFEWLFTLTAESEEYTFRTAFIRSRSCLPNSSCSFPSKNNSD